MNLVLTEEIDIVDLEEKIKFVKFGGQHAAIGTDTTQAYLS